MNLHQIASPLINSINPFVPAEILISDGYIKDKESFKQIPKYLDPFPVSIQLQAVSFEDLKHIEGLNLQGIIKSVYVNGNFYGINRPHQKGGDLLKINNEIWYIVHPIEIWPDWCHFIINLQLSENKKK